MPESAPSKAGALGSGVLVLPVGSLSKRAAMQCSATFPLYTRESQAKVGAPVEIWNIKREEFGFKTKKAKTCQ